MESIVARPLQVAAIDFGTTYSGYALSFRSDYLVDPLKVVTNNWTTGAGRATSLKAPSCILFRPDGEFDSFGYEAEDRYAELALEDNHYNWFYFTRFKMLLYENRDLSRHVMIHDDKGKEMPAMKVFGEGIRFLKDHLLRTCNDGSNMINADEIQWVLTVPAIWDDTAKQFMREAAVRAGISSDQLSLALEPEAASLFCKCLPVEKDSGSATSGGISCFTAGRKYIVLDAGGGTVDITVHETQTDQTVRELYKANGGSWGGTNIDEAFIDFVTDITGIDVMEEFERDHRDDYLDLLRDFEVKKTGFTPSMDQKVTFKIPISLQETYQSVRGEDFKRSLIMKHDLKDDVTFSGDKLRVQPQQIKEFFTKTSDRIIRHLRNIFSQPSVSGTDTILMVGGFSESAMLQQAVKEAFPDMKCIIPAEAGLAVLKGAVIFGHSPNVISSRVSRYTYGVACNKDFIPGTHPDSKRMLCDGVAKCVDCFDRHVQVGDEVEVGKSFEEKKYSPATRAQKRCRLRIYTSGENCPTYVDEPSCAELGNIAVDMSELDPCGDRQFNVKMIYGDTELGVQATVVKTGQIIDAAFEFLDE